MAGAHLLACDASTQDDICFLGADCDELVILLGACFLAVGLQCVICGHAYDASGSIQHVVLGVRIRKQGGLSAISGDRHQYEYLYADPSLPDLKLGQITAFTRERVLSVPDVRVICDAKNCLVNRDYDPDELNFVSRGVFVGVDGPPERAAFAWLGAPRMQWIGEDSSSSTSSSTVSIQAVYQNCVGNGAPTTSAAALEGYAKCGADIYCATYGVPPGVCSTIAGVVIDVITTVFDDALGHVADVGPDPVKMAAFQNWFELIKHVHDDLHLPGERAWLSVTPGTQGGFRALPRGDFIGWYLPNEMGDLFLKYGWDLRKPQILDITTAEYKRRAEVMTKVKLDLIQRAAKASSAKKSSAVVPIVAGLGLAGLAAWWFLFK